MERGAWWVTVHTTVTHGVTKSQTGSQRVRQGHKESDMTERLTLSLIMTLNYNLFYI